VAGAICKFVPVFKVFSLAFGFTGSDAKAFEIIDDATIDMANAMACAANKEKPEATRDGTRIKDI
jgi:hypothetical protein